jgi:curli biogenesis system outer membrane secretion channel CsgG
MKVKLISGLLVLWLTTTGMARAQSLDKEMSALAGSLSKALVAQGSKNVAAIDFTDLQGQPTELGRFLSEQLAVEMVLTGGVSMLDRANIKSILAEHKLTEEGLVNPANAKKLGEFAGVDTILIGTVTSLDAGFVLTVKAISTESAKIVAAGRITFQKTPDLQGIGNRGLSGSATATASTAATAGGGSGTTYQEANAIATKDIGSLRVVLKSVMPMKLTGRNGQSTNGIRCSFEFMNRETRRPLLVAMNAESQNRNSPTVTVLRSSVLDDRGGVWNLSSPALGGLGFVRAGVHGRNGQDAYSASEIVRLLRLRDELGRDEDDPSDGTSDTSGTIQAYQPPGAPLPPRKTFFAFKGNTFISGSTTTIEPGQSVTITMDFVSTADGGPAPKFIQVNSEIVVGVVTTDTKRSYSLQNLTFDRVNMPAAGSR